jgi:hypothetical protein
MKNFIFYSWQSDLPNSTNRGFIESCLSLAIKNLSNSKDFHLDLNLDRDTKEELGTPDIVNTIFKKIERAKFFVADISIINPSSEDRKTPNPNVLLELGYASKVLGWERIICIFNSDYGTYEDLPFDLKFRRHISYSLNGKEKSEVRKYLAKILTKTIQELYTKGILDDELNDFLKVQVDTQILSLLNSIYKILYGYIGQKTFSNYETILNLELDEIKELLNRKFLGFQVFKHYRTVERELCNIARDFLSSAYYKKEIGIVIVNIIKWINKFEKVNSLRHYQEFFISNNEKANEFNVVFGPDINPKNKEGYLLLEKLDNNYGQVVDYGEFQTQKHIDLMLHYFYLNTKYIPHYANILYEFINLVKRWLQLSNSEFIVDNLKHFEITVKDN